MNGLCVDCRVVGCSIDGYAAGIAVNSYSEGLHLIDSVFICGTAITTGTSDYGGSGGGINLLGLYVQGCELNCTNTVLMLYQVNSAWISDTDLYGPRQANQQASGTANTIACLLQGTGRVQISHCLFGGFFNTSNPSNQVAIATAASTAQGAYAVSINDCQFENTTTAVQIGAGSFNITAGASRMFQPGDGALVNTPITYGSVTQQVVLDNSGNTSNDVTWFSTTNGTNRTSYRVLYER